MATYSVEVKSYHRGKTKIKGYTRRNPSKTRTKYEEYLGRMEIKRRRRKLT